jgi:hypothetical protein
MAIFPTADATSHHSHHASNSSFSDLESWAEQAIQSVSTLALSDASIANPASVLAPVPLDLHVDNATAANAASTPRPAAVTASRATRPGTVRLPGGSFVHAHELMRRDSLKPRETLQKGREGTRRRQRWENDRLLSNPYAQPPLPKDWEVHPTYPVRAVPYYLASLWDTELAARSAAAEKAKAKAKAKAKSKTTTTGYDTGVKKSGKTYTGTGTVPKELRETLKRARGAKGLLQDLESDVRSFVEAWEARQKRIAHDMNSRSGSGAGGVKLSSTTTGNAVATDDTSNSASDDEPDSEDDEIVFVGRDGAMTDVPASPGAREMEMELDMEEVEEELQRCKMVFDSLADDKGARFHRWLLHSIANYYGLRTWSVTVGNPARRIAYVGIPEEQQPRRLKAGRPVGGTPNITALPSPLWGMV